MKWKIDGGSEHVVVVKNRKLSRGGNRAGRAELGRANSGPG